MSGKKFYHQRFREKKSYPNHITHIPASKLKWSAPEVDSLRVKTNLIFKGYMTSEGKDAVFKRWRRLTSQDRVLSPVWETIICALPESISGPLQTVHSLKAHKFTAPLPQMNTLKIFFDFPLSLLFPFCRPIARFFVMGGGGGVSQGALLGGLGYPPPENVQVRRLQNAIFSTCHGICLQKINLEYKNGKQFIAIHYNQNNWV